MNGRLARLAAVGCAATAASVLGAMPAAAHNAGHMFLPSGTCIEIGSFKEAPGDLDLIPETQIRRSMSTARALRGPRGARRSSPVHAPSGFRAAPGSRAAPVARARQHGGSVGDRVDPAAGQAGRTTLRTSPKAQGRIHCERCRGTALRVLLSLEGSTPSPSGWGWSPAARMRRVSLLLLLCQEIDGVSVSPLIGVGVRRRFQTRRAMWRLRQRMASRLVLPSAFLRAM